MNLCRATLLTLSLAVSAMTLGSPAAFAQAKARIAFANFNDETSFGSAVLRGMQSAAKQRPDVELLFYDNKQDPARAVENARNIATLRPAAFIEYNVIPQANPQIGRIMRDAKVPVLSVQTRVPDTALFAVDNPLSGYSAGKAVAEAARKRFAGATPAVLLLAFPEGGPLFIDRTVAAKKGVLEVFPDANIEEQSTKNDTVVAQQVATNFLTKHQGRKVIVWGHVDAMGLAALVGARNAGREADVLVSSTGGDAAVFPEVRRPNSSYVGTFSFFPENWGDELIELAVRLAKGENLPETIRPSRQLFLTSENIDKFYKR